MFRHAFAVMLLAALQSLVPLLPPCPPISMTEKKRTKILGIG